MQNTLWRIGFVEVALDNAVSRCAWRRILCAGSVVVDFGAAEVLLSLRVVPARVVLVCWCLHSVYINDWSRRYEGLRVLWFKVF